MGSQLGRVFYAILLVIIWDDPNPTIYIHGVDVPVDAAIINEVLRVLVVFICSGSGIRWYQRMTGISSSGRVLRGLENTYFIADARRWLNPVTKRIHLLGNTSNVTHPRSLVVECVVLAIQLNMGVQIMIEWKNFYRGKKRPKPFQPGF